MTHFYISWTCECKKLYSFAVIAFLFSNLRTSAVFFFWKWTQVLCKEIQSIISCKCHVAWVSCLKPWSHRCWEAPLSIISNVRATEPEEDLYACSCRVCDRWISDEISLHLLRNLSIVSQPCHWITLCHVPFNFQIDNQIRFARDMM